MSVRLEGSGLKMLSSLISDEIMGPLLFTLYEIFESERVEYDIAVVTN